MSESTKAGKLGELQRLLNALTANQDDLSELEGSRARLETALGQVEQLLGRQASYTASKQEATKLLGDVMAECQRLATLLRLGLKQHYGIRSEKLTEFGVPPFRGRNKKGANGEPTETEAPVATQDEALLDSAG
jgi:hypothetical protein